MEKKKKKAEKAQKKSVPSYEQAGPASDQTDKK